MMSDPMPNSTMLKACPWCGLGNVHYAEWCRWGYNFGTGHVYQAPGGAPQVSPAPIEDKLEGWELVFSILLPGLAVLMAIGMMVFSRRPKAGANMFLISGGILGALIGVPIAIVVLQ